MTKRFVTLHGEKHVLAGDSLQVGSVAPDFSLRDQELVLTSLGDFGAKAKLISVVPSLDTSVCDQQTRRFNEQVSSKGAVVITVSVDLPFTQRRWCGAKGLERAVTLSDHFDVKFGEAYGVLIPDLRLLARAVFVLDKSNKILYTEYVPEVSDHPNYEQALKVLNSLGI